MGILDIPLDMMTITIAAITIGIAVDNSIHYIYRFREEYPGRADYVSTLHYCHANIGRAVFYTATTIIIGFSISGDVQFHTDHLFRPAHRPSHVHRLAGSPYPAAEIDSDIPSVPEIESDIWGQSKNSSDMRAIN